MIRLLLAALAAALAAVPGAAVLLLLWLQVGEPGIEQGGAPAYRLQSDREYPVIWQGDPRLYRDLVFEADGAPPLRMTLSLPQPMPDGPVPVMILLGGLDEGQRSLNFAPAVGPRNAIVALEYPWSEVVRARETGPLRRGWTVFRSARATPMQVAWAMQWLAERPWTESERISLLGYSLGAIFLPASFHRAQGAGIRPAPSIMAFGGADLGAILPTALKVRDEPQRAALGLLADLLLRPVEPARHLPFLEGRFLIIAAREDELVPRESAMLLQRLTPEPKTIVEIPGDHIDPRNTAVLARTVAISAEWLIAVGAVNPP